jgi:hypothetical protein
MQVANMPQQYETRRIDVGAVALNVIDAGDGLPVLVRIDQGVMRRTQQRQILVFIDVSAG